MLDYFVYCFIFDCGCSARCFVISSRYVFIPFFFFTAKKCPDRETKINEYIQKLMIKEKNFDESMRSTKRSHRLRLIRKSASIRVKAKPAKKTMDDLPEEIILKIGDFCQMLTWSHIRTPTLEPSRSFQRPASSGKQDLIPKIKVFASKRRMKLKRFHVPRKKCFFADPSPNVIGERTTLRCSMISPFTMTYSLTALCYQCPLP